MTDLASKTVTAPHELLERLAFEHKDTTKFQRARAELQTLLFHATPVETTRDGWRPITSVPNGYDEFIFWLEPKSADESYVDTNGNPIVARGPAMRFIGKYRAWSSLQKATHWQPLPDAPEQLK